MFRISQNVGNNIKKYFPFTNVIENKGYNSEFPNRENKHVAYLSPKELYFDNPVQAERSSGLEKNHPHGELRRSSTHFGVDGKRRCFLTPSCASLARGYQCKSPSGT